MLTSYQRYVRWNNHSWNVLYFTIIYFRLCNINTCYQDEGMDSIIHYVIWCTSSWWLDHTIHFNSQLVRLESWETAKQMVSFANWFCIVLFKGKFTGGLGGSTPLTSVQTLQLPQRNLKPPRKNLTHPELQKCPFLPREGTIFQNLSPAAGFYSILITKMSSFINKMCNFQNFFACGRLWLWATFIAA